MDGRDVPIDVSATRGPHGLEGHPYRHFPGHQRAQESGARTAGTQPNHSNAGGAERTAALSTSEARFRALVEHAPEAIVVFDGDRGRFRFGNEHACRLYGVPMEKLAELTPRRRESQNFSRRDGAPANSRAN